MGALKPSLGNFNLRPGHACHRHSFRARPRLPPAPCHATTFGALLRPAYIAAPAITAIFFSCQICRWVCTTTKESHSSRVM